jgi:hypothetical protein
MLGREKSEPLPTPGPKLEAVLRMVPVRHPESRVLKKTAQGWLMEWDPGDRPPMQFQLDALSSALLNEMDGRRSVAGYVEAFAQTYRLGFLESAALWIAYTRMLVQRNLITMRPPGGAS